MTQTNRIAGGQIDRSQTLRFHFDGLPYQGHPGDTRASALLATDTPHKTATAYRFDRFLKGLMIDEKGQGNTPNLH